jgi:glycolate oxidase iron-sulfur subunit
MAKVLARKNLDAFDVFNLDAIIINAAGCGSHMRHYDRVLEGDPVYEERARVWSEKVRDISEYLVEIGFRKPVKPVRATHASSLPGSNEKIKLTYHEACHLVHGQKVSKQPRSLLASLPGYDLVELPEATWCCGSAGIYNITQPEMASDLQERKVKHIASTGATIVATSNPGCIIQILAGLQQQGLKIRVAHPVTLLAESYRSEKPNLV